MSEKPTHWEYVTTGALTILCCEWTWYEYQQAPDKIPFEPAIMVISYIILLVAYLRWKKEKEAYSQKIIIQNSKNIAIIDKIVATTVHVGDVFYDTKRQIPHALTLPPFIPEIFLGRETEINEIYQKLFSPDGNLLLLVNGDGGVGKTSIASRYYRDYANSYAHVAWVLSEKSIVNALLLLSIPLGLQFKEYATPIERLELLLLELSNLKKPCLLVIDNANELSDLEDNYQFLRRLHNFHLLLTTRVSNFEKAETYRIEGLPYEQAFELFQCYYPKIQPGEEVIFQQIRESVGGNTLVIELLAKNLKQANRFEDCFTLTDLLSNLQDKGVLQITINNPVRTDYHKEGPMRAETPTAIIEAMYEISDLIQEERTLLSNFAVLPAESIGFDMIKTLLSDDINPHYLIKQGLLKPNLHSLSQKGWIEFNEKVATFKCSPVVQEIVRRKNDEIKNDCDVLLNALIMKFEYEGMHLIGTTYDKAIILARYAESLIYNFKTPDISIGSLCERIGSYYLITGAITKSLSMFEKYLDIFKTLYQVDPDNLDFLFGLAISYEKLGDTYYSLGNNDLALSFYQREVLSLHDLCYFYPRNKMFKNGLAISYSKVAETYSSFKRFEVALSYFEKFHQLEKELVESYPQNSAFKNQLATSYEKIGTTHILLENTDQALIYFNQYHQLEKELVELQQLNPLFKNGLATSYSKLGDLYNDLKRYDEALDCYMKFNDLSKELYEDYPPNITFKDSLACSYSKLGYFFVRKEGYRKIARDYFEQCLSLWQKLNDDHPGYVGFKENLKSIQIAIEKTDK